jgi:ABC-type Fe3+-hydroxamate transport system substrate-binding protein
MATKKDIDEAEASIKRLNADMAEWQKDLNGSRFNTELLATIDVEKNYQDFTTRKKTVKIEGGFTKIQVGKSDQTVYGMKGEFMVGLSLTGIFAMERKHVFGFVETVIKGNKSETIMGAKVDLLGGHKYERVKGEKFNLGASPEIQKKSKVVSFVEKGIEKFGAWIAKGTDRIFENSKKVQEQIGAAKQTIAELTKKHTDLKETIKNASVSYGDYKMVGGNSHSFDFANIGITASPFKAFGDAEHVNMIEGQCAIHGGGSYVGPHNSGVSFSGATHRFC